MRNKLCQIIKFLGFSVFVVSCRSTGVKTGLELKAPADFKMTTVQTLTSDGENFGALFDANGTRIVYISRDRSKHSHPQAYERSLADGRERRLTYQDGEVYDVAVDTKDNIFWYASTTDEIKENVDLIQRYAKPLSQKPEPLAAQPAADTVALTAESSSPTNSSSIQNDLLAGEIYSATKDGREIQRWTQEVGPDGHIAKNPARDEIAFVHADKGVRQIRLLNLKNKALTKLAPSQSNQDFPAWSPDGKSLIWSQASTEQPNQTELRHKNIKTGKVETIFTNHGDLLDLRFTPNGEEILMTSNHDATNNFEVYILKRDGSCLRRLTYNSAPDRTPDVSPDGKTLIFTSLRTGKAQIHQVTFEPPACPIPTAPVQ